MKDLIVQGKMLFTECQKRNSFKSYARLKFWILVAVLIDFGQKLRFFDILLKSYQVSQFWSKLAEILDQIITLKRIKEAFLKILIFSGFILIFHQKIGNFAIVRARNSRKIAKHQNFQKSLFDSLQNYLKMIWSKFQLIWTKIMTLDSI